MAMIELLKPTTGTWRVVGARWLLFMLAVVPGPCADAPVCGDAAPCPDGQICEINTCLTP